MSVLIVRDSKHFAIFDKNGQKHFAIFDKSGLQGIVKCLFRTVKL